MTTSALKSAICFAIASLPPRLWPFVSRIVRRIWRGFRDA